MSRSATELHIMVCCYLAETQEELKWTAAMLLRSCVLDYQEKNDTAFITITAPPDSYQILKILDNFGAVDLWIAPEKLPDIVGLVEDEEACYVRAIYETFALLVVDYIEGTPTSLQFRIKEASEISKLQPQKIVNDQSEQFLVRKIIESVSKIESASKKVLGWILKQHCQVHIIDSTLVVIFHGNHPTAREFLHEDKTLQILEQIAHATLGRDFAVRVIDAPAPTEVSAKTEVPQSQKPNDALHETPVSNQGRQFDTEKPVFIWENLRFRSHTEIRIAEALDKRKVLFLPNCAVRLGFRKRKNREADFLVCEKGKWGILEVDSALFHPPTRKVEEDERARSFQAHGILLVEHFDGGECFEDAEGVVNKFLYLLRNQK